MTTEMEPSELSEDAKWFINRPSIRALRRAELDNSVMKRGLQ